MTALQHWFQQPKNPKLSAVLALVGTVTPLAGLHKFYLGQPVWGAAYLALFWTPIPHVASGVEAVWYLLQGETEFDRRFNPDVPITSAQSTFDPTQVGAAADAIRQLDRLRQEGLLSECEFEQKRRQLLDCIATE
ncbi:putative membrane protein [Rubidibacter lacunae KORDI 51-2]|uniref:Putative membrane protein n=1 Tax=Rubidibacter lacunae KORDI 51-2 TaxID=582515 RepID=U5D9Z4_9CHRO|nr:NINE protein [Rubidibacter lacunae]ERN41408.1 putative membrane protein [Rubidibacter lacunae KORDI 51-2]